ncbi:MAG TPA: hypothetical protein VFN20_12430 [Candidatus Acidoferrum sp.]|nr:hypothetical protein [Candidatus Acidoferrum sp.]
MTHVDLSTAAMWLMLLLGAYHGLNPAMGWLFAVALGMQEQKGTTVARSLVPIALGHALSVGAAVAIAVLLGVSLPMVVLRGIVSALLIGLGVLFLVKHWHPRWVRMQVGFGDLTLWSFLMATAHGAGLMVVPVLLRGGGAQAYSGTAGHDYAHQAAAASPLAGFFATAVHTVGCLAVTALVAGIVYHKVGLGILRKAWFNVDLLWAMVLVASGVITLLM